MYLVPLVPQLLASRALVCVRYILENSGVPFFHGDAWDFSVRLRHLEDYHDGPHCSEPPREVEWDRHRHLWHHKCVCDVLRSA